MEDTRIAVRGSLGVLVKVAAERRHLSVSAFATFVLWEYLNRYGEDVLLESTPNSVSPNGVRLDPSLAATLEDDTFWEDDDDEPDDLAAYT